MGGYRHTHRAGLVGLALWLCVAFPAVAFDGPCQGLLNTGMQDIIRSFELEDIERAAFKKHCSKSNDRYSFSDDAEFFWFFGATASPDFDVRQGDAWCKENASRLEQSSVQTLEILTYSQEALRAFNDCRRLEKDNVLVDARVENDTLIISAWRNTSRPSQIQSFSYRDGRLSCSATGPDGEGGVKKLNFTAPIELVDDRRVNIVCRRVPRSSDRSGIEAAVPAETVVLTSDLSTPFVLTLQEEKVLDHATVSRVDRDIAKNAGELEKLNTILSKPSFHSLVSDKQTRGSVGPKSIGRHDYCALSSAVDVHGDQGCGCILKKVEESGEWTLKVSKENVRDVTCRCVAACLG